MIAVLLSLQKSEPEVYTDTMIMALCGVSFSSSTLFSERSFDKPSYVGIWRIVLKLDMSR
jgi:hypothetical protein